MGLCNNTIAVLGTKSLPTLKSSLRSKRSRTKCYVSRASEDSGRAKKGKEQEGVGQRGFPSLFHPLPAPFPFLLSPQFSRDRNLRSHATHSNLLARERLLRRLTKVRTNCFAVVTVAISLYSFKFLIQHFLPTGGKEGRLHEKNSFYVATFT